MGRAPVRADVVIVGAGIAGLMAGRLLSKSGYDVVIVERSRTLADGSTTRNQGWVHAGTFQANTPRALVDPGTRRRITEEAKRGFDFLRAYFPGCREDPRAKTYAIFDSEALGDEARQNWSDADIPYELIPLERFFAACPEISRKVVKAAFEVADVSIDTTRLCGRLAQELLQDGGRIFAGASLIPVDDGQGVMQTAGRRLVVRAGLFVITAGAGIKAFFEDYTGRPFPMRYWQSATLIVPKLTPNGIIWQQRKGVNVMPHGPNQRYFAHPQRS